eukprot:10739942-Alexandrium_andersonii.AAC.1
MPGALARGRLRAGAPAALGLAPPRGRRSALPARGRVVVLVVVIVVGTPAPLGLLGPLPLLLLP